MNPISFPTEALDLSTWLHPSSPEASGNSNVIYDLFAVSEHIGSSFDSGHYTAACKSWIDGKWYRFNDDLVTPLPDNYFETRRAQEMAYVLFYQRRAPAVVET
jgi:ubiquitin C-terminal hydrolase